MLRTKNSSPSFILKRQKMMAEKAKSSASSVKDKRSNPTPVLNMRVVASFGNEMFSRSANAKNIRTGDIYKSVVEEPNSGTSITR